jgi:hypothetical protein
VLAVLVVVKAGPGFLEEGTNLVGRKSKGAIEKYGPDAIKIAILE